MTVTEVRRLVVAPAEPLAALLLLTDGWERTGRREGSCRWPWPDPNASARLGRWFGRRFSRSGAHTLPGSRRTRSKRAIVSGSGVALNARRRISAHTWY